MEPVTKDKQRYKTLLRHANLRKTVQCFGRLSVKANPFLLTHPKSQQTLSSYPVTHQEGKLRSTSSIGGELTYPKGTAIEMVMAQSSITIHKENSTPWQDVTSICSRKKG